MTDAQRERMLAATDALLVGANRRRPTPDPSDPTSPYAKISAVMEVGFPRLKEELLEEASTPDSR